MPAKRMSERFIDLIAQAKDVEQTKQTRGGGAYDRTYEHVDSDALLGWQVKCRNLLAKACGPDSEHYRIFCKTEEPQSFRDNWTELKQLKAVLVAAQEDYDGGYLDEVRTLVQAEVFSDELEQAKELLNAGYKVPAAVLAGAVLETKLRDMCGVYGLSTGKLDKMNADLAKASAYGVLVQKRVVAIADVRNSAAHGKPEKFKDDDVSEMIAYIERFISDHA